MSLNNQKIRLFNSNTSKNFKLINQARLKDPFDYSNALGHSVSPFPCPIDENQQIYDSNTRLELPGSPICQFESFTYKSSIANNAAVHNHVNNFTEVTQFSITSTKFSSMKRRHPGFKKGLTLDCLTFAAV